MWLFSGQGYALVLREMVENIPRRAGESWRAANVGSLAVARRRLGQAPLRLLFDKVAGVCGTAATPGTFWRGLRLLSMDGTLLDVPDSDVTPAPIPALPTVPARPLTRRCGCWPWPSAEPCPARSRLRLLLGRRAHLGPTAAAPAEAGDAAHGRPGLSRLRPVHRHGSQGAQLLWRVSESFRLPLVEVLPDGTYLSELRGKRKSERMPVRVIEYTVTTTTLGQDGSTEEISELFCLITTLLDPDKAPADERPNCTPPGGPAKRSTRTSRSSSAAGALPPCARTAPPWSSRNCGPCSVSTRPCAT